MPDISAPLPHIAVHLIEAPGVGRFGLNWNSCLTAKIDLLRPGSSPEMISCDLTRAAGIFPLRLAWQVQIKSRAQRVDLRDKGLRIIPAHLLNRQITPLEAARVLAHHRLPQPLRHRCLKQPIALRKGNLSLRAFIGKTPRLVLRRSHQKPTRRNPTQALGDVTNRKLGPIAVIIVPRALSPWRSNRCALNCQPCCKCRPLVLI